MEDNIMVGCNGDTYVEKKVDLLHQLGYNATKSLFDGMNEIQIDNKVRQILSISTYKWNKMTS